VGTENRGRPPSTAFQSPAGKCLYRIRTHHPESQFTLVAGSFVPLITRSELPKHRRRKRA
jgi:hypothetical protein